MTEFRAVHDGERARDSPEMSSAPRVCRKCGAEIFADAPEGLCTACLFETGLGLFTDNPVAGVDLSAVASAKADDPGLDAGTSLAAKKKSDRAKAFANFGDYELLEVIGRGGQGVVYRARQKSLNRTVALKVIGLGHWATEAHLKRFRREAEAAARLDHPCIVPIHEVGEREGSCYFSMNLVEGSQLDDVAKREPMSLRSAAELIAKLARAVHYAHEHGILHRDIKPGNILLDAKGEPHLTDFGLARLVETESTVTRTMEVLGTPSYMAPEQAVGNNAAVSSVTDVYGLGAVLYQLLTAHPPFAGGTTYETIKLLLDTEPRQPRLWNPKIDRDLSTICLKCLEKDPRRRYSSALALAEDLERWLKHEPIVARRTGVFTRGRKWVRRNPTSAFLAASLVALAAAASWIIWKSEFSREPATTGIAVLPFENLSDDKKNAFFADGIQDDVLTSLATIKELKVISRTSVMAYRDAGVRNTRQIGQTLGVANVLEGSVRRVGDRVTVNVQLIDTRTDRHLWAKHYDRTLTESLGLQGELAKEIATVLQATLSPNEKARVELRPTNSVPAYEAYLRGIAAEQRGPWRIADLQDSTRAFNEAVQIDPGFALAWAKLSIIHSSIYWMGRDRTVQRLVEARKALDKAGALDPDAGQFYLARGYYHYWGEKNYEAAARDFDEAIKRLPNSADALFALSLIDRRLGRWEEALTHMAQAARLNPRSGVILSSWGVTLHYLRRFAEARAIWDRGLESAPNDASWIILKAWSYQEEGDLETAAKLLQPLPPQPPDSELLQVQHNQLLYERHFQQLIEMEQTALRQDGLSARIRAFNLAALGRAQKLAGDDRAAHASFLAARDILERERQQDAPDDIDFVINVAFVHVGLGDREAALREAERAVAVTATDTLYLPQLQVLVAQIHAQFGDADAALRDLPRLLQTPASDITPAQLRLDPIWDPIRTDPRFQNLAEEKKF